MATNQTIEIVDTTLRDGEQAAGVAFGLTDKIDLAGRLADLGVTELEIGTAACDGPDESAIKTILALGLRCRLTLWCRADIADLNRADMFKAKAVHISLPVSDILLNAMHKDKNWVMNQIETLITSARHKYPFLSVGLQDASRADINFVRIICRKLEEIQVDRSRLADTVGIWEPFTVCDTINNLRTEFPDLPLGFHAHNDLGMAVANTLAAIRGGASSVDVTVNGLGERTGNAPLEEVVMACLTTGLTNCNIDIKQLNSISQLVARLSRRPVPSQKPITGNCAFLHESGIHVNAMLRDCRSYEPFDPESVGRKREDFVIGKHSGRAALQAMLNQWGMTIPAESHKQLMTLVRLTAATQRRALSKDEIILLCHQLEL